MGTKDTTRQSRTVRSAVAYAVRRSADKPQSIKTTNKPNPAGKPEALAAYVDSAKKKIARIINGVPRIETVKDMSAKQRTAISAAGSAPDQFLLDAVDANMKFPAMGAGSGIDAKKTANTIAQTKPLEELSAFMGEQARRLDDLRAQDRHKGGTAALMVYEQGKSRINRGIAGDGEEAAVDKMRKSLGRTRGPKTGPGGGGPPAGPPGSGDTTATAKSPPK